jgi:ribosomal protein S18 acetylase RimI-like enzyme
MDDTSLSVDKRNPAIKLYERMGFKYVGDDGNSDNMYLVF